MKLSPHLEKLASLAKIDISPKAGSAEFARIPYFACRPDGGFVFGWTRDYEFKYFDPAGRLIRAMSKKYDPIPITKADLESAQKDKLQSSQSSRRTARLALWPQYLPEDA